MKDIYRPTIPEIDREIARLKSARKRRKAVLITLCVLFAAAVAAAAYLEIYHPGMLWGWVKQLIMNN